MNHEKLAEKIRLLAVGSASPGPDCPDDYQIAAFVQGTSSLEDNEKLTVHIAVCDSCIERVGRLHRLNSLDSQGAVSDITLARARRLGTKSTLPHQLPRWAAAAVVVLALTFIVGRNVPDFAGLTVSDSASSAEEPRPVDRQARNINSNALRPRILSPHEGANIDIGKTLFRWMEIPGSLYYDIRIVSGDGEMIWQDRVEDTVWKIPGHLQLVSGEEYFVRVDAYLAEAKNINSSHVLFTVKDER